MPDATGLELIAQDLRGAHGDDAVLGTLFFRDRATLDVQRGLPAEELGGEHAVRLGLAQLLREQLEAGRVRHPRCPRAGRR